MAGKVLRVLARGTASAPIHSAHAQGMARFVGRFDDFELGTPFVSVDDAGRKTPGIMPARVCSPEPSVFAQDDDRAEFAEQLRHLSQGDLWPFDAETARIANVPFDPKFGGEYVKDGAALVNVAHRDALKALKAKGEALDAKLAPVTTPSTESK